MKWILIFSLSISVILILFQKFYLIGFNLTVVMPFLQLIKFGIITYLLTIAIKLYRIRDLEGKITVSQGFFFVCFTSLLGIFLFIIANSFIFYEYLKNIPVASRYLENQELLNASWFSLFMVFIKNSYVYYLIVPFVSLIIAKMYSQVD
jgi:hypothetical protein